MSRVGVPENIEELDLSPDAQALLADIMAEAAPAAPDVSEAAEAAKAADVSGEIARAPNTPAPGEPPPPVADPSIDAFTDLLNQLGPDTPTDDTLTDDTPTDDATLEAWSEDDIISAVERVTHSDDDFDVDEDLNEDLNQDLDADNKDDPNAAQDMAAANLQAIDAVLSEDDEEEPPKRGLLARFRRGGGEVGALVGVKDANSAYETQASGSRLPSTILRVLVLILVAAVPPFVNLVFIQPQISDNNRKLSEMQQFEAQSVEDKNAALDLDKKIVRAQKISARLANDLPPSEDFETLFASYIAALERYGVKINKYNVTADKERGAPIANSKMIANLVEIDLVGRYDVYAEIRRVFVEESRQVIVVEEIMSARPDSLELDISAKMIVPTKGKDGGKDSE